MKIYTDVKTNNDSSFVGVVLTGEYDTIYMIKSYELKTNNEANAHLFGIKRALKFITDMDLKLVSDKVKIYNSAYNNKELIEKLSNDNDVRNFIVTQNSRLELRKRETMFDNHMNVVARQRLMYGGRERE